jgi:hypothetical protein
VDWWKSKKKRDRLLHLLVVVVSSLSFFGRLVMGAGSCRREMQGGDNLVRESTRFRARTWPEMPLGE